MASSPDSQPGGPPASSPPTPGSSSSPPSPSTTPSTPPPEASPPPPSAPPPQTPPPSPPAPSPPSPPPQSSPAPPADSPPPQSSPSPPPPESQNSPPPASSPPPPQAVTPTPPSTTTSPPPAPARSPPAPVTPASPDSPPGSPPSVPSPPDTSSSPPVPSTSPLTPSDSSTPSGSTPKSETPGKNVAVNPSPPSPTGADNEHGIRMGIAIGVVAAVIIIGFMLAIVFVQRRRRRHDRYNSVYMLPSPYASSQASAGSSFMKQNSSGGGEFMNPPPDAGGLGNSKSWFSYEELTTATNGFASQNILGAGGFGCVYKGCLQDGRVVAVKKLKDNSGQGDREFKAEVEIISRVHHRHLVSLVGYCITDYQRLLVYEFVANNTLHYHLHASNKPVMEWTLRVKVACGAARGLAYLHEDCHPKIIHRDIKSANILLENNFEAKVADFGLAKLAQELESNTHVSTRVMGTFGYMAPEYASSGKLTEKSDVFSFGVVLLELITGRKPVDETRPLGDESLVEWARPLMTEALDKQSFDELADERLQGNYDRGEMFRMIEAAAACVRHSATKRPKMSQVVRALDSMSELSDLTNGMRPGQSEIYDSREQSAQIRMFQRMAFGSQEFSSDHYNNSQGGWSSGGRSGQV